MSGPLCGTAQGCQGLTCSTLPSTAPRPSRASGCLHRPSAQAIEGDRTEAFETHETGPFENAPNRRKTPQTPIENAPTSLKTPQTAAKRRKTPQTAANTGRLRTPQTAANTRFAVSQP
eukprot:1777972-Lingulodinium_polyedra.AAC.1